MIICQVARQHQPRRRRDTETPGSAAGLQSRPAVRGRIRRTREHTAIIPFACSSDFGRARRVATPPNLTAAALDVLSVLRGETLGVSEPLWQNGRASAAVARRRRSALALLQESLEFG